MVPSEPKKSRARIVLTAGLKSLAIFGLVLSVFAVFHPDSPLPDEWNPRSPLQVAAPVTVLTNWKLRRAVAEPALCLSILREAADVLSVDNVASENPNCGIDDAVTLASVGAARINVQTSCPVALRLAMWELHGVQPAAHVHLGVGVASIIENGSYNCRPIRDGSGNARRWSTHATGAAIDVSGFVLTDGQRLSLLRNWDGAAAPAAFFRDVRDSSCDWFVTTLSPDYNALHADHFHLQSIGWGTCR